MKRYKGDAMLYERYERYESIRSAMTRYEAI
jgi:hypothetical protein